MPTLLEEKRPSSSLLNLQLWQLLENTYNVNNVFSHILLPGLFDGVDYSMVLK